MIDWRQEIASADEWIGWEVSFCYWCGQEQSEGHTEDCVWVKAQEVKPDQHHHDKYTCDECDEVWKEGFDDGRYPED